MAGRCPEICPATASAVASLRSLASSARKEGKRRYDEGPGKQLRNVRDSTDNAVLTRKQRKVASAYVSRFSSQSYHQMLPQAIDSARECIAKLNILRQRYAQENDLLQKKVSAIERELHRSQSEPRYQNDKFVSGVVPKVEEVELEPESLFCGVSDGTPWNDPRSLFEGATSYWHMDFNFDTFASQV